MENYEFLRLSPRRIKISPLEEWRVWEGKSLKFYDKTHPYIHKANLFSNVNKDVNFAIYVSQNRLCMGLISPCCKEIFYIGAETKPEEFKKEEYFPENTINITVPVDILHKRGRWNCDLCRFFFGCKLCTYCVSTFCTSRNHIQAELTLEFIKDEEYYEIVKQKKELESNKEDTIMAKKEATKNLTIKTALYERSPKENLETVKLWAEKYKPTLRWVIPVVTIYGAYRILNSKEFDLTVNNVAEKCEEKFGFKLKILEDKKALKELMALGGISAGAYGALKIATNMLGSDKKELIKEGDMSIEDFDREMNKLDQTAKKFSWIQPKMEEMLPIALSVILVYVSLHKPKKDSKIFGKIWSLSEDIQVKIKAYLVLAKLFIEAKFKIDLSDEKQQKKAKAFAGIIAILGICAFIYGKKVLGDKTAENEEKAVSDQTEKFVEQLKDIIRKIAPTAYTTLVTMLVSKKILKLEDAKIPVNPSEESYAKTKTDAEEEDIYYEN